MAEVELNLPRLGSADGIKAALSFLLCGLLACLFFSWLTTRPSLKTFWYLKADKFLIPRYTYWTAFGLICLLSLTVGYAISRSLNWMHAQSNRSWAQSLLACVIVAASAPILSIAGAAMNPLLGLSWDFLAAPLIFIVLFSIALCIFTGDLRLTPVAFLWNLVFAIVGGGFVAGALRLINGASEWYDFVQWPILIGMLAFSCGSWLVWRERVGDQRTV